MPVGRNSPQHVPFGLYAEQFSGTAFTAPRHENRRSWLYRLRPSAEHPPFTRYEGAPRFAPGTIDAPLAPNRLRWDPLPLPGKAADVVVYGFLSDGLAMPGIGRRLVEEIAAVRYPPQWWVALLVLVAWTVVAGGLGWLVGARRDVT